MLGTTKSNLSGHLCTNEFEITTFVTNICHRAIILLVSWVTDTPDNQVLVPIACVAKSSDPKLIREAVSAVHLDMYVLKLVLMERMLPISEIPVFLKRTTTLVQIPSQTTCSTNPTSLGKRLFQIYKDRDTVTRGMEKTAIMKPHPELRFHSK
jgi:hypothetical protein